MADDPELSLERRVRDTLDSVLSPSVREALLSDAFLAGKVSSMPEDLQRLREFVLGPLRDVLIRALGTELGDSVACELDRMLDVEERASSSRRPHGSPGLNATPPRRRNSPPPRTAWPPSVPRGALATLRSAAPTPPAPPPVSSPVSSQSARSARGKTPETVRPRRDTKTPRAIPPPRPSMLAESTSDTIPGSSAGVPSVAEPDSRGSLEPPAVSGAFHSNYQSPRAPNIPTLRAGKPPLSSQVPRPPSSSELPRGTAATLGVRGASPSSVPSRRLPGVLVATEDSTLARKLSQWLDPHVSVSRVSSLISLVLELAEWSENRVLIVLDCNQPSIRPIALAAIADDLPASTDVVLWGATPELEREILMISSRTGGWLACSSETSAKDVAGRCAALVS